MPAADDVVRGPVATSAVYECRVSHGGCSGVFWRPAGPWGAGGATPTCTEWPRNGAVLQGDEYRAEDGARWLLAKRMRQANSAAWEACSASCWMPFDGGESNGGRWLHATRVTPPA